MSSSATAKGPESSTAVVDELFEAKSAFYIGAYSQCLAEVQRLAKLDSLEKDCLMWRALIAQRSFRAVLDGIRDQPERGADPLQALRRLAQHRQSADVDGAQAAAIRAPILDWFDEHQRTVLGADADGESREANVARVQWLCTAAAIYYAEGQLETALKLLHGRPELECLAMAVQTLIRMQRPDLARAQHMRMQATDDDATLTQLATAWLAIETGGDRLQDAYHIYTDLADRQLAGSSGTAQPTAMLQNGQVVCLIGQQRYDEAYAVLRQLLERDRSDCEALRNALALGQLWDGASVPPFATAAASGGEPWPLQQLRDVPPNGGQQLLAELERVGRVFDGLCVDSQQNVRRVPVA